MGLDRMSEFHTPFKILKKLFTNYFVYFFKDYDIGAHYNILGSSWLACFCIDRKIRFGCSMQMWENRTIISSLVRERERKKKP
jgi:hypothetical protein